MGARGRDRPTESKDVKRNSNFRTSDYMFEFEFDFKKFDIRIQLALKRAWVVKRGCHIIVCEQDTMSLFFAVRCRPLLHPSIDAAAIDAADV